MCIDFWLPEPLGAFISRTASIYHCSHPRVNLFLDTAMPKELTATCPYRAPYFNLSCLLFPLHPFRGSIDTPFPGFCFTRCRIRPHPLRGLPPTLFRVSSTPVRGPVAPLPGFMSPRTRTPTAAATTTTTTTRRNGTQCTRLIGKTRTVSEHILQIRGWCLGRGRRKNG